MSSTALTMAFCVLSTSASISPGSFLRFRRANTRSRLVDLNSTAARHLRTVVPRMSPKFFGLSASDIAETFSLRSNSLDQVAATIRSKMERRVPELLIRSKIGHTSSMVRSRSVTTGIW